MKYDQDLRPPTVLEAQSADKQIWSAVAELMEKGWSMDDKYSRTDSDP